MAKKARVYDGTAWQELASAQTDLTAYSTTAQMNTAINASKKILQVVGNTTTTETSISSGTYADSGLTATITPLFASSKILVLISQTITTYSNSSDRALAAIQTLRGATVVYSAGSYNFASLVDSASALSRFEKDDWVLIGQNYEGLTWLSESEKPTLEELENLWEEVEGELQAKADAVVATRSSALAKLAAIGLTPEEIASL